VEKRITDDLGALLDILPPHIRQTLADLEDRHDLLEVVLDLGRVPEARFPQRELVLDEQEITEQDIEYLTGRVSAFGGDNRSGIERTLHRISAIRNRSGRIVGLTCRVGRAVYGTVSIIEDLVQSGRSVLLLGRPGVGKTTMLREIARVLADEYGKRVIIVDTSNEIAGDGDIPHPAIGHARRMQVATPNMQHAVMIEAVENHMPEVIVIDEIGTALEAQAARTIAERGVQLVATAHGNALENLMMNPTLSDLIGGIQSVTLGDEEARRRRTQKSILERMSSPTFDILVEIQEWDRVAIHPDVGEAVDAILRGQPPATEIRWANEAGEMQVEKVVPASPERRPAAQPQPEVKKNGSHRFFLFGVNRGRMEQVAQDLNVSLEIVNDLETATLLVTSKKYYRQKPNKVKEAEAANLPIFVLRGNTLPQMRQLLTTIYPVEVPREDSSFEKALGEAERAVDQVRSGEETVELSPQSAYIRRLQHLIAERNALSSQSTGKDPYRRVRIYRG
jgi:stage III sporulation protein SpoIIIAA